MCDGNQKNLKSQRRRRKYYYYYYFHKEVLLNINFWILIIADILIYFILKAFSDWSIKLLKEDRGFGSMVSSTCLSAYESGGVVGTLFTGIISDYLHSRRNSNKLFLRFNFVSIHISIVFIRKRCVISNYIYRAIFSWF